jgi:hypothetical protein
MQTSSTTSALRRIALGVFAVCLPNAMGFLCRSAGADEPQAKPAPVDFVRDIQPILARHCYKCHGPSKQEGGLRLNARDAALAGGDSGQKAIVPSDPKASRLVAAIDGSDDDLKMPPEDGGQPLTASQVVLITRWVREGAIWPADADHPAARLNHWAWQKPRKATLPAVQHADWPRHALDYFVLARLEKSGLAPAPEADRYMLARRVHLDLVGLPPTPQDVEAFVNDTQPGAYAGMVDRALADPGYGERWARVWLDLARYADSKGYGSDPLRTIWRYRDWVIEAFNRNLPYDRFTIEQLAGDLLPQPTPEQILATAFHRNTMANDEGGTDDEEFRVAAVKDRIETTFQVWMGLTMGCAKCHSHKFDPITQREYYQAYALFNQTEDADRGDEEPKVVTPTRLQEQQIADAETLIVAVQRRLATPPANLEAELAQWEQALREREHAWVILEPQTAAANDGANLQTLPDHSLLASGASPDQATYRVEAATDLNAITAFRLEALSDESLPQQGPGRTNGNFVLNDFRIGAAPRPAGPISGRFVRIEIPGDKKILSLAEVQVFQGPENVAPQGKATQSSTASDGTAALAVDGTTDGIFANKSVTHTNEQTDPWWELDLGRTAAVERIVVWNRTDPGTESRLKDFRVTVLDENRQTLWRRTVAAPPQPSLQLDLAEPAELELTEATADFSQEGWPVDKAIDGDPSAQSGWAVSPQFGKPHYAIFKTKLPVSLAGPKTLSFTLVQSYGGKHTLGRFRISATTAAAPPRALPQSIHEILAVAAEIRSTEQRAELARYYWVQSAAGAAQPDRTMGNANQGDSQADALDAHHA